MKNIKPVLALFAAMAIGNNLMATDFPLERLKESAIFKIQTNLSPEVFMRQAMLYQLKETQMSGIAADNTQHKKLKTFAKGTLDLNTAAKEELLSLAKIKNITLPESKPQGGQRPDGRVDSAPTNLQDTSRNQNQGEAGNSGQPKDAVLPGFKMMRDNDLETSLSNIRDLKDANFDKAYLTASLEDHQNMVTLFEAGSKSSDSAVKKYSSKYLPKFRASLAQITSLANMK